MTDSTTTDGSDHVSNKYANFREFLDNVQYSREGILSYEKIFGRYFISVGGEQSTKEICGQLPFQRGQKVLDVGCGIGGNAFFIAKHYGATVLGIDLSQNMISIAQERLDETQQPNVSFELADTTIREFPEASFDVICSRDAILHIKDKLVLFRNFNRWLKPGGKLLITDYCCKDGKWSDEYTAYVKNRGYYVLPVSEYGKLIESAGFENVLAKDNTTDFLRFLREELERIHDMKDEFSKDGLTEEHFQSLVQGWKNKIVRSTAGDQLWGLFIAQKPGGSADC